jgi:BirA family biotin operon repressor/biotin-[acetyl-CoA-carboxylase] ligase
MANFDPARLLELPGTKSVDYRPSSPSTSDRARELLSDASLSLPLLVITDHQTAGRGQPGKSWMADQNSLTFTWCVADTSANSKSAKRQSLLPLIAGLVVCESLDSLGVKSASIKWPNDILIGSNKVAGILVESISVGQTRRIMFGIGLNVNQSDSTSLVASEPSSAGTAESESSLADQTPFSPTSLSQACGRTFDLQKVLTSIVVNLHQQFVSVETDSNDLIAKINRRFSFTHKLIQVAQPDGKTVSGVCQGMGPNGELRLTVDDVEQRIFSGSIVG